MKKILLISLLSISISGICQKFSPRLDTLNAKVVFMDEEGVFYETFKTAGGKLSFIKNGKEKKCKCDPYYDTLSNGKVILYDRDCIGYETFRSANGYTTAFINGKNVKLQRRGEKPVKPIINEL